MLTYVYGTSDAWDDPTPFAGLCASSADRSGATPRRTPVQPDDLIDANLALVPGGASMSGTRADALLAPDTAEHQRRVGAGVGAVRSLGLLDALMGLPIGHPVSGRSLTERERHFLESAPDGVCDVYGSAIVRLLRQPAEVHAVLVSGGRWRSLIQRAARFAGVSQRIIVLRQMPRDPNALLWEADIEAAGVWVRREDHYVELRAPDVHVPKLIKPARWRFQENAYDAWIKPRRPGGSHVDDAHHRVRQATAENYRQQTSLRPG